MDSFSKLANRLREKHENLKDYKKLMRDGEQAALSGRYRLAYRLYGEALGISEESGLSEKKQSKAYISASYAGVKMMGMPRNLIREARKHIRIAEASVEGLVRLGAVKSDDLNTINLGGGCENGMCGPSDRIYVDQVMHLHSVLHNNVHGAASDLITAAEEIQPRNPRRAETLTKIAEVRLIEIHATLSRDGKSYGYADGDGADF